MDESGKKAMSPQETNVEQAKAALKARYDAAAQAVYQIKTIKPMTGAPVTQADLDEILRHYGNLSNFRPELMDERFKEEVEALKQDCKQILDGPIDDLFKQ